MASAGMIFVCVLGVALLIYYIMKKCKKESFEYPRPDRKTAIGGMKGACPMCHNGVGYYGEERVQFKSGGPANRYGKRTLIDPAQVGFSTNGIVNRNQYSDFYDSVGTRRQNPNFKFFTRFNGLELNPMTYSEPEYSFSMI
jgi:hypothetical protein